MHLRRILCLSAAALLAGACAFAGEPVTLEKPVQVSTLKADKSPLTGKVYSYDEDGFELARGKERPSKVSWAELAPAGVFNVHSAILGPRATGDQWLELGRTMLAIDGGEPFAKRAFDKALKLDPALKDRIEAAKTQPPEKKQPAGAKRIAGNEAHPATTEGAGSAATPAGAVGPQMIGKVQAGAWPPLTEEQRAQKVAELKQFAGEAQKRLKKELALQETKYFLFYSDLPAQEARNWAGLLDRMYDRLAELFGVDREPRATGAGRGDYVNVWAGKAVVFVFQSADDYRRFQALVHNTDAGGSAGMCHCYGDGRVHIAFYRQQDPLTFAHVLVHESVHGFIHRFRTSANVPSWANEGLAEVIATELVPQNGYSKQRELLARQALQTHADIGPMFDAAHIEAWQYPVAEKLTGYMIQQSKRNYVDFIMGIKDGLTWQQSLEQRYKAPKDRLVRAYRESLGLKK